jgi:hypothetical protein
VLIFLGYIAGVLLLYIHLQAPAIFTSLILIVNFIVLFLLGNYMLRGILFPYANKYIRRQLDSAINKRFSTEFARLILLMAHMVRIMAEQESVESYYMVKEDLNNSGEQVKRSSEVSSGNVSLDNSMEFKVDIKQTIIEIN